MDNLDDSENNAKISDSAYSNSCSNSHSRRSRSSKSTNSGSRSSGSSGYGGKPSAFCENSGQPAEVRLLDKDTKKKKQAQIEMILEDETEIEQTPLEPDQETCDEANLEEIENVVHSPSPSKSEKGIESMDISSSDRSTTKDDGRSCSTPLFIVPNNVTSRCYSDGFSCVISMHDGVVMYTTVSLTTTLGFPKDMWIGRSFIDFVHPSDRHTFASHITSGFAVPKNVNGTLKAVPSSHNTVCTMVCRIRKYRNLSSGFGVKERSLKFLPFLLKLSFKNAEDEGKIVYLVILATPFFSAFKIPNEPVLKPLPFVIRHSANGTVEYVDPESVPYLGYLPQDLANKDALQLYHPEDLTFLRRVYETIVKEGTAPRSKPYRMLTQNGHYVKVETEWSSFINPWSKKLEFIIGKHFIVEGPRNPDVFQAQKIDKSNKKVSEEEKDKIQALRDSILRVVNEVLTKPAEVSKQQMSKRCHDLAVFMETFMEDGPKAEDDLRLEIQDADQSCYERDSFMLGGISPHHDYNDSKSSIESLLSYNQLNYHENLQRYFTSQQPYSYEDYNTATGENILRPKSPKTNTWTMSPMCQASVESEKISSCESEPSMSGISTGRGDFVPVRLTELMINKHNAEMEKELLKVRRETRSSGKGERGKATNQTRQQKIEHLARCNAAFQPTAAVDMSTQNHGVKRSVKLSQAEAGPSKIHCSGQKASRRRLPANTTAHPSTSVTSTTTVAAQWPSNSMSGMNTYVLGAGIPQQMPMMSPMVAMPGMFPIYCATGNNLGMPSASDMNYTMLGNTDAAFQCQHSHQDVPLHQPQLAYPYSQQESNPQPNHRDHQQHLPHPPMQCMMYGQPMFGSPVMYAPMNSMMQFSMQQIPMQQTSEVNPITVPIGLANSHYVEVCKPSMTYKSKANVHKLWRERRLTKRTSLKIDQCSGDSFSSPPVSVIQKSETTQEKTNCSDKKSGEDRTDEESSYSSFYSSFFKTESGSAEDSDAKKAGDNDRNIALGTNNTYYEPPLVKKIPKRKMDPPWMEEVKVTSELIYKYQILTQNIDDVLKSDKLKMSNVEQPSLVNEQLDQLYVDLQLQGVAARLTLEEGITSSASSGDEGTVVVTKTKVRRKREYSQLVMIYEEDAPFPPSPEEQICVAGTSKS